METEFNFWGSETEVGYQNIMVIDTAYDHILWTPGVKSSQLLLGIAEV
jgi:hypothetical protein